MVWGQYNTILLLGHVEGKVENCYLSGVTRTHPLPTQCMHLSLATSQTAGYTEQHL